MVMNSEFNADVIFHVTCCFEKYIIYLMISNFNGWWCRIVRKDFIIRLLKQSLMDYLCVCGYLANSCVMKDKTNQSNLFSFWIIFNPSLILLFCFVFLRISWLILNNWILIMSHYNKVANRRNIKKHENIERWLMMLDSYLILIIKDLLIDNTLMLVKSME